MSRPPSSSFDSQLDLFEAANGTSPRRGVATASAPGVDGERDRVGTATFDEQLVALAAQLDARFGGRLYLGTSSWSFPGWRGLVWDDRDYTESQLARTGLRAYARHPLLRTVSLDRGYHRALDRDTFARLAAQTPERFRFVVKAPSQITDAVLRAGDSGAPVGDNPRFLDARRALDAVVAPAVDGLGDRLGAIVFQFPPLPVPWLRNGRALLDRMDVLWRAVVPAMPASASIAIEVRDPRMLTPNLIAQLARHRVAYCIGLHDNMPALQQQMSLAHGAGGGGDLICRWSLRQGLRYNQAMAQWAPFNRLQASDIPTREALAQAVVGTLSAGYRAFVAINNKAEGSAPLSVLELARAILREAGPLRADPPEL
jgi:uncharacterized protein YecE (DUF72 family)